MTYLFAMTYRDRADDFVGFVLVEATGDSAEHASRDIERSKCDREWLLAAFRTRDHQDLDGIVVGEHVVIGPVVTDDRGQALAIDSRVP
jgi:hypothetical protein